MRALILNDINKPREVNNFIVLVIIAFGFGGPVWAADTKTMECETYIANEHTKQERLKWVFRFDVDQSKVQVTFPEQYSDHSNNNPIRETWEVVWKSKNNLRVVAIDIQGEQPADKKSFTSRELFFPPVTMFDLDFQDPRYRQISLGALSSFDKLVPNQRRAKCKRLD
jgi:hypothetical protein